MLTRRILSLLALGTLAISAHAGRLIAIDASRELFDLNPVTGAKTSIGFASAGVGTPGDIARNDVTGTIYVASMSLDQLSSLDLATGNTTLIGSFSSTTVIMLGLEWDSTQHALWGASNGNLFRIGETNGATTQIGTSGITSFTSLGYVPATDMLYAANAGTDQFYSVNRGTGVFTAIGPLGAGATNSSSLAYDTDNGVMYMIDNVADNLYTVDVVSGAATVVGSTGAGNLQGMLYIPGSTPFTTYCSGNGSGTACPCGNAGAAGNGCANSVNAAGAHLSATGNASVGNDTMGLQAGGMPNSSALYFQGSASQSGGAGAVFGDGLRCATGTIIRLATKSNSGGFSSYPVFPDLSVAVRGQCMPGNLRFYQVWYRNAAAFCTTSTFNLTNGVSVTWLP